MRYTPNLSTLIIFLGIITMACSKSDPKPLGAQTNAVLLAGDKGKSKSWKLREMDYQEGTGTLTPQSLDPCILDNIYTFSNNDAQSYSLSDASVKCYTTAPDVIESGTWAFTLDGLTLNIEADNSQSPTGLFSAEIYILSGTGGNYAANGGYTPFPAFVQKIDANNLILEINETFQTNKYKFVLTFTAI